MFPMHKKKKQWGEASGARNYYKKRNEQIRGEFRNGCSMEELADEYNLSVDSIRKIVY